MTDKQIVRMFKSIPKFETYSKYNSTLERIFKTCNLKNFMETLNRQQTIKENSIFDDVKSNEPIDIYAQEESDFKNIHNDDDSDIFDEMYDKKHHSEIKDRRIGHGLGKSNIADLKRKRIKPILDPFKYNPNYNSIYKNVPSWKIVEPKKNLSQISDRYKGRNKTNSKHKAEKQFITEENISPSKNNSNNVSQKIDLSQVTSINRKTLNDLGNTKDSKNNSPKKSELKLPKLTSLTKAKIIDSITCENDNHALRFSKYIPRKFIIPENNKNISYLNPVNHILPKKRNKSIDFEKMLQRNEKDFVYVSNLKTPSFALYNPKYTYVEKNEKIKWFNPEDKEVKNHRKYLMRKLWGSYKVNTEYLFVDNGKIKKNNNN